MCHCKLYLPEVTVSKFKALRETKYTSILFVTLKDQQLIKNLCCMVKHSLAQPSMEIRRKQFDTWQILRKTFKNSPSPA